MVGLSEDVVREGWTGHSPGHPGPHQAAGPFYVPARSREYVTATLNVVTFSTQGHAHTLRPTHSEALPTPTAPPNPRDPSLALYLPSTALCLLFHLLLPRLLSHPRKSGSRRQALLPRCPSSSPFSPQPPGWRPSAFTSSSVRGSNNHGTCAQSSGSGYGKAIVGGGGVQPLP